MRTACLLLITVALCSALVASQGTDVTIRLFTDFGILGDPSPSNIGAVTASPTGSAYVLARVETPVFEGWYTACALSFSNFPFFGIAVDIYGPLIAIGDTTDDSIIFYYVNGFVPTTGAQKEAEDDFTARMVDSAEGAMMYGYAYGYETPYGYQAPYQAPYGAYGGEGGNYGGNYGYGNYGGEGGNYGGEGYGGEGYGGYGGEGYGGYGGEGYGGEGYGGYGGEGYGGEGYGGYGGEGYYDPYGWGPGYIYEDEYIPYEWTPYGGYGGTDADDYEYGEAGYGGYGGYDYGEVLPTYSADYPGFYYWNSLIPGSWLEDRIAATVPADDALICGFRNETSGDGRQFYVQFADFLQKDADADFDSTTVEERLGCGLCAFGQRLTIGQQFVASTCNQPCIAEVDETESAECTMVCIIPTGTNEFRPVLALPTYQGNIDKTVEGQANRYFTALDSYSSFLVSAGCFLERKATGFNKNIGGFSPVIMLCKMNGRGTVNEKSCDRGPFRVLQNEGLNQCPSSVAVYGEDKKAQFIALGFSSRNAVYVFKLTEGTPFTSQQLRSWQKVTLDATNNTPGFGHTVSFSANDEVFGGVLPDKLLLAVGAFGDVGNSTGATFIFGSVEDQDPDDFDLEDCPTTNENCFFVMTPATMSSYNYPTGFSYGFAAEMDAESVALVTVDLSTGFWEFDSFPECEPGEQFTDTDCFPCPTGQYSDEKSYNPCELCPAGSFNPRAGSASDSSCLPCNRGEFCAAGARVPVEQRYADEQVYAFNNPDPEASPQLHFETTFFFSVVPPALILGLLIIILFLPFLCSCLYRFGIFRNFRSVVCAINLIDDADDDLLSSFFTVWLILSTVFLIVFAILFATKVNDSLELTLKTLDDIADLESANDLTILDEVPFQISVAYIGLADYLSCDDKTFEVEIDGCFYDDKRCDPDIHFKQSRLEPTGARICNITFGFEEGTLLNRFSDFAIKTRPGVKRFYTQMVWWKAATLNDDDTDAGGNSYISGEVQPLTGTILRGRGDVSALTTLTPLMDCRAQELNWVTFLLVTSEANCEFVPEDSLKSFSHLVNKTQDASVADFYLPNKLFEEFEGYDFHVTLEKGRYYLLKQEAFYVTNAQIFILVVLLIFGFWWGFLQLIKFLIDRCYGAGRDCCTAVAS